MSQPHDNQIDVTLMAAQWVVRAQSADFRDEDILGLTEWLDASPGHARAFEDAMLTWNLCDDVRDAGAEALDDGVVNLGGFRSRAAARQTLTNHTSANKTPLWRTPGALTGIAAALVAAVTLATFALQSTPAKVFETQKGKQLTVALADGSTLQLNTDTRVSVQLSGHARKLVLERGEVALKVVHDASRPLTLTAGETVITDIGTEFNVRRDDRSVAVAVRQGEIQFAENGSFPTRLHRGDAAVHQNGITGAVVSHGDPDEAFAWQTAHAIYRDLPLALVVKDLNRYFDEPIVVDDQAGKLRLSAILTLDSEPLVVRRLQDFLPVQAKTTGQGIYISPVAHAGGKL